MALRSFAAAAVAAVVAASCMTATALAAPVPADSCTASGYLPAGHQEVPCVTVPRCDASNSAPSSVHIATFANGTAGPADTTVTLCYDKDFLYLRYECAADPFLKNTYSQCNTETYNQEVSEIFISPGADDTTHYHEIEITPHDTLYVAEISNPYMNGTDKANTLIDCGKSGIVWNATSNPSSHSWDASLSLPWSLVSANPADGSVPADLPTVWRINLFRVIMHQDVDMCNDDGTCVFMTWSPTFTQPAAFHWTKPFGVMVLES